MNNIRIVAEGKHEKGEGGGLGGLGATPGEHLKPAKYADCSNNDDYVCLACMHDANLLAKAEGSRSIDNASDTKQTATAPAQQQHDTSNSNNSRTTTGSEKCVAAASERRENAEQQKHLTTCKCSQPNRLSLPPCLSPTLTHSLCLFLNVQLTD